LESIRPPGWTTNAETARHIEEKLNTNSKLRQQVERARSFATTPSAKAPQKPDAPTSFVAIALPAGKTVDDPNSPYALRDNFLLDSVATTQISDNRDRFTAFRQCSEREYLLAGTVKLLIQGVGRVELTVEGPDGFLTIFLGDVAFVPSFHASVASLNCFMAKVVHWRTDDGVLTFRFKTFCKIITHLGQSLLEYTPLHLSSQLIPYISAQLPAADHNTEPLPGPFRTPQATTGLDKNLHNYATTAGLAETPQLPHNNNKKLATTWDTSTALEPLSDCAANVAECCPAASSSTKLFDKNLVLCSLGVNLHHGTTMFLPTWTREIFSAHSDTRDPQGQSHLYLLLLLCTITMSITWELIFPTTCLSITL
jgi:hypothetical protein